MNPDLAVKLAQEIGSLVVQCHSLQLDLDQAQQKITRLETTLEEIAKAKAAKETT